jgi:hypothetical protein
MNFTQLRPIVLAILSVLVQIGVVSQEFSAVIADNSSAIISGVFAVWAIIAWRRNRKEGL